MQAKSQLALVVPTGEKRAVSAGRRSNADYRKREYLTPAEIEKLIEAAKGNRYGHRDATMILVAFRHGFRASEIIELEWSDIDFNAAEMHVERKKRGKSPRHPIRGDELRALRRLHKEQDPKSAFVFVSERGAPFTRDSFNWMVFGEALPGLLPRLINPTAPRQMQELNDQAPHDRCGLLGP